MDRKPDDEDRQWHLDKKVPLALIGTIILQTVLISWWAATTSTRLDNLEKKVESAAPQSERIVRLEEKIGFVNEKLGVVQQGVAEIKQLVSRPTQHP